MGTPNSISPPQPEETRGFHPPTHGNWAQWAAIAVAIIIPFALRYYERTASQDAENFNLRVDARIDAKLNPAVEKINDSIDRKLEPINKKLDELTRVVGQIQGRLGIFDADQKKINIRLDQQASLAKLVLSNLQRNLNATDRSTPGYWPTVAEFVTYRSQVSVGTAFQTLSRRDMPNCTDNLPTPMEYRMTAEEEKNSAGPNPNQVIPALYENCRFVLDSPEEAARVPYAREGRAFLIKFKNCQIVYNGGIIAVLNPHPGISTINGKGPTRGDVYIIRGQQIDFENCLFLFSIKTIPPQDGQSMTRELLAQSGPVFSYGKIKIG